MIVTYIYFAREMIEASKKRKRAAMQKEKMEKKAKKEAAKAGEKEA